MNKRIHKDFFWLHIKKSAGMSTRKLLLPHYKEVDRGKKPKNFIQATPEEYNDILNNYRIVLGEYQFKRALFAKKYLYPDNWNSIPSFAFSRQPVDRCISMFYYLYYKKSFIRKLKSLKYLKNNKKIGFSISYDFDIFLELVENAHFESQSIFSPFGLHFTTHTAPMFNDVTNFEGDILLTKIYRLEDLNEGINQVFEMCGLNHDIQNNMNEFRNKNKNKKRGNYTPNKSQIKKIEIIYKQDFELYENADKALYN